MGAGPGEVAAVMRVMAVVTIRVKKAGGRRKEAVREGGGWAFKTLVRL